MKFLNLILTLLIFQISNLSQAAPPAPRLISFLTYNVWMVDAPFSMVSQDIEARAAAIPLEIKKTGADIVALQEVWPDRKKEDMIKIFKENGYPFSFYEDLSPSIFLRGLVGNGLLIVSKFPLESSPHQEERVMGFSDYTRRDEYFARKGALHVRARIDGWGVLNLYNTHLGAESYTPELKQFDKENEVNRQKQALELFGFIKATQDHDPSILMGDFNSHPKALIDGVFSLDDLPDYHRLTCSPVGLNCLDLRDSYRALHLNEDFPATVDPDKNPYVGQAVVYKAKPPPRTIDYIFIANSPSIKLISSEVTLQNSIEIAGRAAKLPLSDHFAVLTRIELAEKPKTGR